MDVYRDREAGKFLSASMDAKVPISLDIELGADGYQPLHVASGKNRRRKVERLTCALPSYRVI